MRGIVAAGHLETARAAATVLADGGNAIDAALAGLCAATVAEPVLASLGGGGFLLARPADGAGRTVVYDFFAQTPKRRRPPGEAEQREVAADFGPAQQTFHVGTGTIATPGVVKGLFEAHQDLGRMPLRSLVEPAVRLARDGVLVDATQAYILRVVRAIVESGPSMRALFASPERDGALVQEGELLKMPELADALEILAIEGSDLFYRGEMAARLARDCAASGGHLSMQDLRDYRVHRREPLALDGFDARVELNPPPSQGGLLVAFGLALQQGMDRLPEPFGSTGHLRRLVGLMQATAEARLTLRPERQPAEVQSAMLSPDLLERYRARARGAPPAPRGTTQISVIQADGTAASLSVSNGEGCGYVLPGTGIILNNMLGEADLSPEGPGVWPADARLASMMAPALVRYRDGGITALGSGGSSRIRSAMLQVLLNLLALRMPLQEAIAAPRLHLEQDLLSAEPGFAEAALTQAAAGIGQLDRWPERNMFFGGVHAAHRGPGGGLDAAGDARRGGAVMRA